MEHVYVKFENGQEAFYTDVVAVTDKNTFNSTDALRLTIFWSGESTVNEYIPLEDIEFYEVFDQDDPDAESRHIEFINNN